MRIVVDYDLCESNAICMGIAPEVFEVRDDDFLYVLTRPRARSCGPKVEEAVRRCPKQAITHRRGLIASDQTVVIVGGSLAGLRAAETLREEGFDGTVIVVDAEEPGRPTTGRRCRSRCWPARGSRADARLPVDAGRPRGRLRLGVPGHRPRPRRPSARPRRRSHRVASTAS